MTGVEQGNGIRKWLRVAAVVLVGVAVGCGREGAGDVGPSVVVPTVVWPNAELPTEEVPATMPAVITIAGTTANVMLPFRVDASGAAGAPVGAVSIAADVGTLELDGAAMPIAFYERQPWEEAGYVLHQGIAVGASRIDVVWLYCESGTLTHVWHEGVTGPSLDYVNASGACTSDATETSASISFPGVTLDVPPPVLGYTLAGDDVTLDATGEGILRLDDTALPFVVFADVDCTACGGAGWHELHSLVWDEANARAIVLILYLDFAFPERVYAAYARSLPDFGDPVGDLEIPATWTAASSLTATVPVRPRPNPGRARR